jgi:glucose/arabinose dehydrogenase
MILDKPRQLLEQSVQYLPFAMKFPFRSASTFALSLILATTADAAFPPLALELVAEGQFGAPTSVTHSSDGSGRLFIADQRGTVHILIDGAVLPTPFLDLSEQLVPERDGFDERGLLGLAFHPEFGTAGAPGEGLFYVYYSAPSPDAPGTPGDPVNHLSVVAEFEVSAGDPNVADPASERVLLTFDQPQFNHDGGQIAFGPVDGLLYIGTGDGGSSNDNNAGHTGGSEARPTDALGNSQDRTNLLGKILRIDPRGSDGPGGEYGIPPGNPFVGEGGGVREEIFAYGLRNPWRFSFDDGPGGTNRLFCADVGQNRVEEINLIVNGGNYGWRNKEGEFTPDFSIDAPTLTGTVVDPVAQYAHPGVTVGSPELLQVGLSVTGGHVYRGSAIPALQGKYVFGDWSDGFATPNGTLLGLEETSPGVFALSILELLGGNPIGRHIPAFGEDEAGELYVATKTSLAPSAPDPDTGLPAGQLFRIVEPPDPVEISLEPARDTVLFSESGSLSNGSGPHLFAGRTNTAALRRSLLAFDLSSVPADSTVSAATLTLGMTKTVTGASDLSLHRVTADWGEAGSDSGSPGGGGAPAQVGDATWTRSFFDTVSWTAEGGDFVASESATAGVGGIGDYSWSAAAMIDDVQAWIDGAEANHGWLLRGDETATSAKRFASRENPVAADRPTLNVTYTPAPELTHRRKWERQFFPAGTFLDPGADEDGDAIPLLLEYGWDLDPTSRQDAADFFSFAVDRANDRVHISFARDPRAADLTYILETSDDLDTWTDLVTSTAGGIAAGAGFIDESTDESNPELIRVNARDTAAPSAGGPRFSRLRVVLVRP